MKKLVRTAILAAVGVSALALSAVSASAEIVCNREGECWHVKGHYEYRGEWGIVVHPDSWSWGRGENYRWHEHAGRGYWNHGRWIAF
jgi:hypothetical protein